MVNNYLTIARNEQNRHFGGYAWSIKMNGNDAIMKVNYLDGVTFAVKNYETDEGGYIVISADGYDYKSMVTYGGFYDNADNYADAMVMAVKRAVNAFNYYW